MTKKKNLSQEDLDTWLNYTKNPTDIIDKDYNSKEGASNLERFKFDLHGYTLQKANEKIKELILLCSKKNYKEILLITGKGIHSNNDKDIYSSKDLSKLRYSVPDFINSNLSLSQYVSSISDAEKKDGGKGAIIIKLKKLKNKF